jgi:hypothetical protein
MCLIVYVVQHELALSATEIFLATHVVTMLIYVSLHVARNGACVVIFLKERPALLRHWLSVSFEHKCESRH